MAWRNLGRNRRRTGLALTAIAIGQLALIAMAGTMNGFADQIKLAVTGPMMGHAQIHHPDWREERAMELYVGNLESILQSIREDPRVNTAAPRIYAPVLVAPEEEAFAALAIGLDIKKESASNGLLSGYEGTLKENEVLVGHILANRIGLETGREVALIGQGADGSIANDLFTVAEIVSTPSDELNRSGVIMNFGRAQTLFAMWNKAHEITVRGSTGTDARALVADLTPKPVLEGYEILPWQDLAPELVSYLKMAEISAYFVLILVFIAAAASIANTMMMSTFERMHELGMLLALGTRPIRLVRLLMTEALALGFLGVAAGTAIGLLAVWASSSTGIDMAQMGGEAVRDLSYKGLTIPFHVYPRVTSTQVFSGVVTVIVTSLLATLWPAVIAARLQPMEAMRR